MAIFSSSSNHTCPMPRHLAKGTSCTVAGIFIRLTLPIDAPENYVANLSFRQLNMIISGAATGIVIISIFILMARHATHFSKPNEQAKYVRAAC
jgi:hypothetical protein